MAIRVTLEERRFLYRLKMQGKSLVGANATFGERPSIGCRSKRLMTGFSISHQSGNCSCVTAVAPGKTEKAGRLRAAHAKR